MTSATGLAADAIGIFLEEIPVRLVSVHRSFWTGATEDVPSAAAHALKGLSGMLGADRLSSLSAQMEAPRRG